MKKEGSIAGFSKLSREEKTEWLRTAYKLDNRTVETIKNHLHGDEPLQALYEDLSENTISNFFIPYGIAPNFLINGKWYAVPMAIEESSVVAAASHAAKFWSAHGGFNAEVTETIKTGQVHFRYTGDAGKLQVFFNDSKKELLSSVKPLTASMEKRGGGIEDITLEDKSSSLSEYFQLFVKFRSADAMGANFINTVLEQLASSWKMKVEEALKEGRLDGEMDIDMAILSNYTPENRVKVKLEAPVEAFKYFSEGMSGEEFARKFVRAMNIAATDPYRAVTHNKGIFNGMDAVVIATGNDFRAVEACGHAWAARNGRYGSLSSARIENNSLVIELDVAMAVGTVGGLTSGHPMARTSMEILGHPSAEELMMIIAAAGLANNFSAVRSLITSGIQQGHMKMHLGNILRQLGASEEQARRAKEYFRDRTVSFSEVKEFLRS